MFKSGCLLVVDYLCFISAVTTGLFTQNKSVVFAGGINPRFVPTEASLINKLSSVQIKNTSLVNLELSNVSTGPIRAITKYLTIYY
jgi:hypothetical protein